MDPTPLFSFTILGELTSLNEYLSAVNSHRLAGNAIKKSETERVAYTAMKNCKNLKCSPFDNQVHVTFHWYSKDERRDIDNVAFAKKFILDGLVLSGKLKNDSRAHVSGFSDHFFIDKEKPRVEVELHAV